jgi:hypothetical protein
MWGMVKIRLKKREREYRRRVAQAGQSVSPESKRARFRRTKRTKIVVFDPFRSLSIPVLETP